jgi:ACS family hexuronate transporter-like MFS transporter
MKPSPRRWLMVAFACGATTINYLDRQTLSVVAPVVIDQFHMSNVVYSRIVTGFLLAYALANGVSGPLIDWLGTRVGYALCVGWWSAASMLHALARGALSLGVFRFLLGMGEAGNWPAAIKMVAEWFPEHERALATGLFNSGSAIGAIIAPPAVAFLVPRIGWPATFAAIGPIGFVWTLLWWLLYRSPPSAAPAAGGPAPQAAPMPLRQVIRTRFIVTYTLSRFFTEPAWYFYIFWFPQYLKRMRGFDIAAIGRYAWIPFAVAAVGNLFGGSVAALFLRRGCSMTVARKGTVTIFAIAMTAAAPAALVGSAAVAIGLVSIAMLGYTGSLANIMAMPADVFDKNRVSSVYGLASMGSCLASMLYTLLTGWVIDHYSYVPVFLGFGLMPLVCTLIQWTLMGPLDRKIEIIPPAPGAPALAPSPAG